MEIIKDCWKNNKISPSKLIKLSTLSIKLNEKNEYYLSISELKGLIKNELNPIEDDFDIEKYHLFWKNFLNQQDKKELKREFKELFSKYTNVIFYLKLTRKKNVPLAMENWIKECSNQKNFNATILNGIISFVFSLLKKIPVKYLTTMCENLNNDGIHTTDQLLSHIKEVLKYERVKKNRLGLTVEEISK
ncbi:hypothetical protein [Mycoplasma parvum]|uniref:DnaD domain-containing protein n=1 Tax=Mycoplasma parvum str. Indiana TaxID=1403316 RepID=U5ND85_9MOLU|nr:hypothetical protein [Mycoplasma parvum]AGX89342.1 hypothetical protein PRV_03085 [Mycoplasma parvum str. Indiana]